MDLDLVVLAVLVAAELGLLALAVPTLMGNDD
jgi:hypothetical protein